MVLSDAIFGVVPTHYHVPLPHRRVILDCITARFKLVLQIIMRTQTGTICKRFPTVNGGNDPLRTRLFARRSFLF